MKYKHIMTCDKITFVDEQAKEHYSSNDGHNADKFYQEIEGIFKKYGVKSANLIYDLFNQTKESKVWSNQ